MVEEFDNTNTNLIKMDFLIKSKSINVKHCVFKFVPQISWLRKLLSYIKMVFLPILFMTLMTFQFFGVLILYLFFNKIKPHESEKTNPAITETTTKENILEDSTTTVYTEATVLQDLQEQTADNLNK